MYKLFFLLAFTLQFSLYSSTLGNIITKINIINDKEIITFQTPIELQKGVSGFIVRDLGMDHHIIIATLVITDYNQSNKNAQAVVKEFHLLDQDALPNGDWVVQKGDEVQIANNYSRALLIAPSEESYYYITKNAKNLEWVHPDKFAAFLSYRGHPTPQEEDFQDFCTLANVGLLYIYSKSSLFTLDCQTLALLQKTPTNFTQKNSILPFYSRIEKIDKSWFGITWFDEGNEDLRNYDAYYLQLIQENSSDLKLNKGDF